MILLIRNRSFCPCAKHNACPWTLAKLARDEACKILSSDVNTLKQHLYSMQMRKDFDAKPISAGAYI
jgi:hypothetical protein